MQDNRNVLQVLQAEFAFLERGGYRRIPRYPWRPNFIFEDSPTCINFARGGERQPCEDCLLIGFVPENRRAAQFPCRHIPLTPRGETVNSFYEWGTDEELEAALKEWLLGTIRELEGNQKAKVQAA